MILDSVLFSATTIHLDHMMTALNCLTPFGQRDDVIITIDRDGLSFACENNHSIKIQLFLSKELFQYYNYRGDADGEDEDSHVKLSMKVNHILDTVSVANRDKDDVMECTLSYNGDGYPFVIILEDSMITEKVEYSTYLLNDIDSTGLELDRTRLDFECIIKGDILHSALKDLKEIGCKDCYIYTVTNTHTRPIFALISKSQLGFSKIILPSERSILEKLEIYDSDSTTIVHDSPVIGMFDFSSLDKLRLSTKIASKVLIRRDVHGLLTINILSQTNDVLMADKKPATANRNNLPIEYPGIVIEVSLLEKAAADDVDVRDIHLLMTTSTTQKITLSKCTAAEGSHISNVEKDSENLLGFKKPTNVSAQETNTDDSYHPAPSTNIPLFF
ncbi:Rad17p Ecym_5010 [Eremothecium cymbalariae DBVPG|uniref:DNA damage checkpoint control protein RAD17 n=1 Tax=Eremothecium cymbalariae (strain CBS 270.75 / DBVPG 7215 / KCTC 17166 / NRRL Y-17582) TaxID=931890 RepID=I6NCM1_ERECY|nr:hypothetical protein Ecym_5010 [Eremothecium cymbalariae DBVPG\